MTIKKVYIILLAVILFLSNLEAKIGIHILPVKCVNEEAFHSGKDKTAIRVLENEFAREPMKYNIRISLRKSLEEIQMQMGGLVKEKDIKGLEAVDYFLISSLWEDHKTTIFEIRAMSADTGRVIYSSGFTVNKGAFKKELNRLINNMKNFLKEEGYDEKIKGDKFHITVYTIEEDGEQFLSEAVAAMFFTGLSRTGEFSVIEREGAKWAIQEKEVIASGIMNRDPLKKYGRLYDIDYAIEGYVVTRNKNIIGYDIKVIDVSRAKLIFKTYDECYSIKDMRRKVENISRKIAEKFYRRLSRLEVRSIPENASLYINDRYWAKTPVDITDIEKGIYTITLMKQDYENYKREISLKSGEKKKINVRLERLDKKYFKLGKQAEKQKKWKTAIEYYKAFSKAYPDVKESVDARFCVAHIYHYELKNLEKAVEAYKELIKSHSGLWILSESMYGLGSCLIDRGDIVQGREILKELLREYPETSAAGYAREKLK